MLQDPEAARGSESCGDWSRAAGAWGAAGCPRRAERSLPRGGGGGAWRPSRERLRPERRAGRRANGGACGCEAGRDGAGAMWNGRSSFTSLVVGVFVVYVVHTCWVMYGIVYTRPCAGDGNCIQPYLARRPKLQVSAGGLRDPERGRGVAWPGALLTGARGEGWSGGPSQLERGPGLRWAGPRGDSNHLGRGWGLLT